MAYRFGVPALLILAALAMCLAVALRHTDQISPIDEWVYLDYLFKFPSDVIAQQGEAIGHQALQQMSCEGVKPYGAMGAPCGSVYESQRGLYPQEGLTSADAYTPLYFVLTWLAGKVIQTLTALGEVPSYRLTGFFWLAGGLLAFYLLMRAMRVPKLAILALGLVFIATPFAWWTYTYVNTDAPSFFFGALMLWVAIRYLQGGMTGWWLVPLGSAAVLFKVTNMLAVGLVVLLLVVVAVAKIVAQRRGMAEDELPRPWHLIRLAMVILVAAGASELLWLTIRAAIAVGDPPYQEILARPTLGQLGLGEQLMNFLPGTINANVVVTGGAGSFAYTIPGFLIAPASWLCVAGVIGWLLVRKVGILENALAWTVAISATIFAPVLVVAMVAIQGMFFQLPPRYGAPVLPGFLLAAGMLMTSKSSRLIATAYAVLLLVFVVVFACRFA
ncbi:hypothetical protein [Glaciibacter sp. 2TAF33]|uniref:hypothetical protein n=1 Tax=Glaciibacter sp. 2TAF33 TaxID=3233015 RepID=UPI003F8F374E